MATWSPGTGGSVDWTPAAWRSPATASARPPKPRSPCWPSSAAVRRFRHQVLFYPVTDANFDTESYRQFATGYYLRRDAMQWSWDRYTTDPAQRARPTASPLRSLEQLAGLPPAPGHHRRS